MAEPRRFPPPWTVEWLYLTSAGLPGCALFTHHQHWTCPGFVEGCGLGIRVSGLTAFCSPVWCHSFVRPPAEPFFHPGLHDGAAVARRGGQGRPHLGPPEGLVLDGREHGGRL